MKPGMEILAVASGGACGALARYGISLFTHWAIKSQFPWGTLAANVIGCLLIGMVLGGEHDQRSEWLRVGFGVGFLGALTTFSTFGGETIRNAIDGNWGIAITNVLFNVALSLGAVWLGIFFGKKLWG